MNPEFQRFLINLAITGGMILITFLMVKLRGSKTDTEHFWYSFQLLQHRIKFANWAQMLSLHDQIREFEQDYLGRGFKKDTIEKCVADLKQKYNDRQIVLRRRLTAVKQA
jgi:hypothetical protein